MSLYQDKQSVIHRLHPITKLVLIPFWLLLSFLIPNQLFVSILFLICISLVLAGKVFKQMVPLLFFSFLLFISLFIIQGVWSPDNQTLLFNAGFLSFYKEGLTAALLLVLRMLVLIASVSLLVLTTRPSELVDSLTKKGLPNSYGYMLNAILQIIPEMRLSMTQIADAQRARGLEIEGSIFQRTKAFFPLLGPVVMNTLNYVKERSLALEVRGFSSGQSKTYVNEPSYISGVFLYIGMGVIMAGAMLWRFLA